MKSQGLQKLVNKIFNDEETKLQFESDPETVMSKFNLTAPEKKAVMKIRTRLGMVTSNSPQLEAALDSAFSWMAPTP